VHDAKGKGGHEVISNRVLSRVRRRHALAAALASVAAIATAALAAAPAAAAATSVTTIDPAGAEFTCGTTTYTVTGGTLQLIQGATTSANGSGHFSLKRVPHAVTLVDGSTDTVYRLVGAGSANGEVSTTGQFAFTDVTHFHIIVPNGGVVGTVSTVLRLSKNGTGFSFNFGDCQTPQDG
jgi:hypothetical protein